MRQAQAKANELIAQAQTKFKEMRKASNDYVDDLMRRTDEVTCRKFGRTAEDPAEHQDFSA